MDTNEKYSRVIELIKPMRKAIVCFSGGVDSTLLLKASVDALGEGNVIALIGTSESYPDREVQEAHDLAVRMGALSIILETNEMEDTDYTRNTKDRCYYCKTHLFSTAWDVARQKGFDHVLEGSNKDDEQDYRPGRRACAEKGVRSPLLEAGLTKADIRQISKELGLPTHDKPSLACLASRVPYGTTIDAELLKRIERSEEYIRSLGVRQVRVRAHGHIARIEVAEEEFDAVVVHRDEIADELHKNGFLYVTMDLKGYRTGSMNEGLSVLE